MACNVEVELSHQDKMTLVRMFVDGNMTVESRSVFEDAIEGGDDTSIALMNAVINEAAIECLRRKVKQEEQKDA